MKKLCKILACFFCMALSVSCFADGKMIPVESLPEAVKSFVAAHFPDKNIIYVEMEHELSGPRYEVRLNDGSKVDCNKKGEWDKVDCKMLPVPAALVPAEIAGFVSAQYPGAQIVKIDKERYGFEIELSNSLELKFNKKGQLISIDD